MEGGEVVWGLQRIDKGKVEEVAEGGRVISSVFQRGSGSMWYRHQGLKGTAGA